jgi:glycosyltransferase involved in cell wall biosynthesis
MEILVILCQDPFAQFDGGTYATRSALHKLSEKGQVAVAGFGGAFALPFIGPYRSVGSLGQVSNSRLSFLLSATFGKSYSVRKYSDVSAVARCRRILEQRPYSLIWCEKLLASCVVIRALSNQNKKARPKIVIRSHNIEHKLLIDRFQKKNLIQRKLIDAEAKHLELYEVGAPRLVDQVFTITEEDCATYRAMSPGMAERIEYLPVAVNSVCGETHTGTVNQRNLLFVGDCNWQPNLLAAKWIVEQLSPLLEKELPNLRIRLVGKGTDKLGALPGNVECAGFVDSLDEEYVSALCSIAPIWTGSGINIKVIDALAHGRPVIGTQFARRGIHSKAYLAAETPQQFIRAVTTLLEDEARYGKFVQDAKQDTDRSNEQFDIVWSAFRGRVGV